MNALRSTSRSLRRPTPSGASTQVTGESCTVQARDGGSALAGVVVLDASSGVDAQAFADLLRWCSPSMRVLLLTGDGAPPLMSDLAGVAMLHRESSSDEVAQLVRQLLVDAEASQPAACPPQTREGRR